MRSIRREVQRYGISAAIFVGLLLVVASCLIAISVKNVIDSGYESTLTWFLLAFIIAGTSAKYPIRFFANGTGISVSEGLIFLGVLLLGPCHGALLGAVDNVLASRRLKTSTLLCIFNASNAVVSVFIAGSLALAVGQHLETNAIGAGLTQRVIRLSFPLVTLALADYLCQIAILGGLSSFNRDVRILDRIRDTLPWEPMTFMAGATLAGLFHYAVTYHGHVLTLLILLMAFPFPVLVYYMFKTYRDKLGQQQHHYEEVTGIYDSILEMLAMAIDAKDDVTHDHIQRVKLFARRMGELLGLTEREIEALKAGALLHDIGKIGVPAYILNKPGKLSQHEFEQMKMHTIIGADMLSNINFRYPVVPIVRHHHERWDGRGYPDGLSGDAIPLTARILTLVDNYDALRSDRPYKKGMTREEALNYIRQNAGIFFDPRLVETFLSVVDQLEVEAESIKCQQSRNPARSTVTTAMQQAAPAAGLENLPQVDRAAAALHSIAETNLRVTALYEMSRTLSSILSLEDTVAILANRLSKLVPFTTCAIALFDASRSEFEVIHSVGRHADRFLKRRQPAEAGITGYVITNQRPLFNTNPVLDLGFLGHETASEYKTVMVCPLVKNSEAIGAIALYSSEIEQYSVEHTQLMESICQPASDAISNALAMEQAHRDALSDQVTGLPSMRVLSSQFERDFARSHRLGTSVSVVMVKINNLDEATALAETTSKRLLASVAELIKGQIRETDLVARHSSDVFAVLLPDAGPAEATLVCERILDSLSGCNAPYNFPVSVGWAGSPKDGTAIEDVLKAAYENAQSRTTSSSGRDSNHPPSSVPAPVSKNQQMGVGV